MPGNVLEWIAFLSPLAWLAYHIYTTGTTGDPRREP